MTRFSILGLVAALAFVFVSCGTTPPSAGDTIPIDTAVRVGRLDNGLTYYVRENTKPENNAELRLVVKAGSILEDQDQRGLAHFVEHMAFNGSRDFDRNELIDYLESVGVQFGADLNARTGFDDTVFRLQVPTDDPEKLGTGLNVLLNWAFLLELSDEEIDRERGVIIEEWRTSRGADARIRDKQFPILLQGSLYADRMPIGLMDVIQNTPPERLRDFYRDFYRPDMMAVVAVGDFDADWVEQRITSLFASAQNPKGSPSVPDHTLPHHDEMLFALAADPELTETRLALYVKRDPSPTRTDLDYRDSMVKWLFVGLLNDRLEELTNGQDSPFLSGETTRNAFVRSADVTYLGGRVKEGEVIRGLEAMLTETERAKRFGFTQTELDRQKSSTMSRIERLYKERENTPSGSHVREYVGHFLESEIIPGIVYEHELYQRMLPGITLEEVNAVGETWIEPTNRVLLVSAPDEAQLPDRAELAAVFDRVAVADLEPYEDQVSEEPLLATVPSPLPVVEEAVLQPIDTVYWRLANGIQVYLKKTDFKNDEILFEALSPGGHSLLDDRDYVAAVTSIGLLEEAGLGPFTKTDLEKKLAGKQVAVRPYIASIYEGMEGSSSVADLETMFQLIYLAFTEPRRDEEAFARFQAKMRESIETRLASPETPFYDKVSMWLSNNHFRSEPMTLERLEMMSLDKSLEIYKDRFADAGDFTFVFVGALDLDVMRPLVETYLGGLPVTGRQETWRNLGIVPPKGVILDEVKRGIEPVSRVQFAFTDQFVWSMEEDFLLRAMSGVLETRLTEKIREEVGGTYSIGVFSGTSRNPNSVYRVFIGFGADPQRVDELTEMVFDEIRWLQNGSVDASYVQKQREILGRDLEMSVETNGYWSSNLATSLRRLEDPVDILRNASLIDSMTVEKIQETARKYLRDDQYIKITLLPEM